MTGQDSLRKGHVGEALRVACLGWGSLVWRPGSLKLCGPWHEDGPLLPLEFARTSDKGVGRLTLVITPGASEVPTLWAVLAYPTIDESVAALIDREKCQPLGVGVWPNDAQSQLPGGEVIGQWGRAKGFHYVIWTALPPQFRGERGRAPASAAEAIAYLEQRNPGILADAEEYVRRAPAQIRTSFRSAFEQHFGWTPAPNPHLGR